MTASKVCTQCPAIIPQGHSRCDTCTTRADKQRRPHGNPYNTKGHHTFRRAVLARDPICMICMATQSNVADHYPHERVDLILMAHNPNDPQWGRGLCKPCHDKHTAKTKPSGWNKRSP